jgi:DNA polymerase V
MFFPQKELVRKEESKIMRCVDLVNASWGQSTLRMAAEGIDQKWYMRQDQKSQRYTTCWMELPQIHG